MPCGIAAPARHVSVYLATVKALNKSINLGIDYLRENTKRAQLDIIIGLLARQCEILCLPRDILRGRRSRQRGRRDHHMPGVAKLTVGIRRRRPPPRPALCLELDVLGPQLDREQ